MINVSHLKSHAYDVVGAIHEVHRQMGPGLNEYVYQEALEMELKLRGIPYEREVTFHPDYKGMEMKAEYRLDFLCKGDIIIELKAVSELCRDHKAQLYNYMRLRNAKVGILVNFAPRYAEIERYIYDSDRREILTADGYPLYREED